MADDLGRQDVRVLIRVPRATWFRRRPGRRRRPHGEISRLPQRSDAYCSSHLAFCRPSRWGNSATDPETGQAIGRNSLFDIDPKWDNPSNDELGDFYSSHVHPTFWRLHGWIDDGIKRLGQGQRRPYRGHHSRGRSFIQGGRAATRSATKDPSGLLRRTSRTRSVVDLSPLDYSCEAI